MPLWESKNSHDCKCNLYLNFFLTLKVLQRRFIPSPFCTILSSGIVGNTSSSCPRIAEEKQDWQAPYLLQHISITRIIHWTSWVTLAFQWARGITMTQRCEFQMHAEIIGGYKTPGRHSLESLVWSECTESYFQTKGRARTDSTEQWETLP